MARLIVKSNGFQDQVIELHLGVNRFGRGPDNDFQIEHPTISARHCEISVDHDELKVTDCDSTNGTYIAGRQIKEGRLRAGQTLCLGEVELWVETTEVKIAIPKIEAPSTPSFVVREDGSMVCPRHAPAQMTHRCTHCGEILCEHCIHRLRRRGGKPLMLCPLCSHPCESIVGEKKKKHRLLGFLQKTVKLPFSHKRPEGE